MKIFVITNNKGGVLKTTLTANLSKYFSVDKKCKTLIIDTDQQGNLAAAFGYQPNNLKNTLASFAKNPNASYTACCIAINPKLDLIASNIEFGLLSDEDKELAVKVLLNKIQNEYDYVLIDTSPSMNSFILSLIEQADKIIIPAVPETLAVMGMKLILDSIDDLDLKKQAEIITVWTRFNTRSVLNNEVNEAWDKDIKRYQKELKKVKLKKWNGYISNSIKNDNAVAYDKLPLSFLKEKNKNKTEFEALFKFINK